MPTLNSIPHVVQVWYGGDGTVRLQSTAIRRLIYYRTVWAVRYPENVYFVNVEA